MRALRVNPVEAGSGGGGPGHEREGTGFRSVPPWGWFLAGELAIVALAVSGLMGSFEPTAVFAIGVTTLAALVLAVRHHRPRVAWPWWAIAASLALFLVGGALRFDFHTLGNITPSRSLVPDLISLPGLRPGGGGSAGLFAGP